MIIILLFILTIIFAFIKFIFIDDSEKHKIIHIALSLTPNILALSLVIVVITSFIHTKNIKLSDSVENKQTIVTLTNKTTSNGTFFLGTGTLNSKEYYCYYYKTKSGSYKFNKIEADKCEIIYTDKTPHIDTITKTKIVDKKAKDSWFTINFLLNMKLALEECDEKYLIYVPKGTIVTDFSINLDN